MYYGPWVNFCVLGRGGGAWIYARVAMWYAVCVGGAPGVYNSASAAKAAMASVSVPLCVECTSEVEARECFRKFQPSKPACLVVYVDGACSGNGKRGAVAGVGVFWGYGHKDNVCRPVSGSVHTNNVGELQAIDDALATIARKIKASPVLVSTTSFRIMSDSQYSISAVTVWHDQWKAKGWKTKSGTTPANLETICRIHDALGSLKDLGVDISLLYTPAHENPLYGPGNDEADKLAKLGGKGGAPVPAAPAPVPSVRPLKDTVSPARSGRPCTPSVCAVPAPTPAPTPAPFKPCVSVPIVLPSGGGSVLPAKDSKGMFASVPKSPISAPASGILKRGREEGSSFSDTRRPVKKTVRPPSSASSSLSSPSQSSGSSCSGCGRSLCSGCSCCSTSSCTGERGRSSRCSGCSCCSTSSYSGCSGCSRC